MDLTCSSISSTTARNAQSWVWKHFSLERQPSSKEKFPPAKCKQCLKYVSRSRGNTTNMTRHIQREHGELCVMEELSKPLIANPPEIPPNVKEADLKEANDLLVNAIVWGLLPMCVVDNPFLRLFVEKVSRDSFALPHRTKLTEMVDKKYEEVKELLTKNLALASSVAITTDAATMKNTGDAYVAITGHWITPTWKLMSAVLGVKISDESHTGETIFALVKEVTQKEFFLADRLDAVGTDNGSNFVRAVELMLSENVTEEHIRCACHTLQLSVKKAIETVQPVVELVELFRKIVNTISGSPVLLKALRDKQNNANLSFQFELPSSDDQSMPHEQQMDEEESDEELSEMQSADESDHEFLHWGVTKKVIKDVVTRWNSTFFMLQRAVELKEAIDFVLIDTGRVDISPSDEQWNSAMLLCSFLQPFAVVTDILQGEKYPTLGCVSRYISYLLQALNLSHPPDSWNLYNCAWPQQDAAIVAIRKFILADMERRWNIVHPLFLMGSITHPGHKSLSWLPSNERQKGIDQLFSEMKNVSGSEVIVPSAPEVHSDPNDPGTPGAKRPKVTLFDQAKALFSFSTSPRPGLNTEDKLGDELHRYLNEPEIDHLSGDPLAWWAQHQHAYPHVASLAQKYLAIPASTAPSERVFSTAKNLQQKRRWRILPSRLHKVIFLRHNHAVLAD